MLCYYLLAIIIQIISDAYRYCNKSEDMPSEVITEPQTIGIESNPEMGGWSKMCIMEFRAPEGKVCILYTFKCQSLEVFNFCMFLCHIR